MQESEKALLSQMVTGMSEESKREEAQKFTSQKAETQKMMDQLTLQLKSAQGLP